MKRILILALAFLTACASSNAQTPASFFDREPDPLNLTMDSTSEQIQRGMLESAAHWTSLQFDGTVTWYSPDGSTQVFQEQVWLDPLNSRFKSQLTGTVNSSDARMKISDGTTVYEVDLPTNIISQYSPYPDFARVGQYVPPLQEGVASPNPIWGQLGTPLSQLAFSSDFSQNKGTFKPIAMETIAGRQTLAVEWTSIENSAPSFKAWLDTQTGVMLKLQEFGKEGGAQIQGERVINTILFNPVLDASIFVLPVGVAQPTAPAQAESMPVITGSAPMSAEEAGELYFFLQPRTAGQSIQLAKVSGMCVVDSVNCPPLEKVNVPFAFNFTINALSWSPDGKLAAFAYSDQPNGTPTKLWLFDADAKTWKSIAQYPYIDPPFWSPDGAWIAFRVQDGMGGEDVVVVRPDGTELKNVSAGLPTQGKPYIMDGWFKDSIMMRSALPEGGNPIYLVQASDGLASPMLQTLPAKNQFVTAPDATLLAYADYDPNSQNNVVKVTTPDGATVTQLATFTGGSVYPIVWSPDSQLVAFNYYKNFANGDPSAEVYVSSRNGGTPSLVYTGVTVGRLLFSPNGKYLLVEETTSITGGHIFWVDLSTLKNGILQAPGLSTDFDWYAPSWRP